MKYVRYHLCYRWWHFLLAPFRWSQWMAEEEYDSLKVMDTYNGLQSNRKQIKITWKEETVEKV